MKRHRRVACLTQRLRGRMLAVIAAVALGTSLCSCTRTDREASGPPEKVTMACATLTEATLVRIAQSRGFFSQEGLETTEHLHRYGKPALKEVLDGTADFATVAETPLMLAIMQGADVYVLATISTSSSGHVILARRDQGVQRLGDLKGKKIATMPGTTAHLYQDMILALNGLSPMDVQTVGMDVDAMDAALAAGEVAAVSTFYPHIAILQKSLGERLITFHDKDIYTYSFNVVASRGFVRKNPGKVRKMLRGLLKAEAYVREHPAEAQTAMSGFNGADGEIVSKIWGEFTFEVALDQKLILQLEDQSRWAMNLGLTGARQVPNYLDYIYFDGLQSLRPQSVRILR